MNGWRVFPQEPGPRASSLSKSWLGKYRWAASIDAWCARKFAWQRPDPREKRSKFQRSQWLRRLGHSQRTGRRLFTAREERFPRMSPFRYRRMMADILK